MTQLFNARLREQRRAVVAEAARRGVPVEDLRKTMSPNELSDLIDKAAPVRDLWLWMLPPRAALDGRPSSGVPAIEAAVAAAVVGDWEPAAEVMTESYGDWDLRARAVDALAAVAADDDGWLLTWQTFRPDDGHAAVVDCAARTELAWQLRGRTERQRADFRRVLSDAETAAKRAMTALPDDPTPWATMLTIARGLGYDHDEFGRLWQDLLDRAPLHRRGHEAALLYWSSPRGSRERMFAFAQEAAERSPSLSVLVLQAAVEAQAEDPKVWRRPAVRTALDALLGWLETEGAESVNVRDNLGFGALAAVESKRGKDAIGLFRRLGGYAGGAPWCNSPVPVGAFNRCRERACALAGRGRMGLSVPRFLARSLRSAASRGVDSVAELAPVMVRLVMSRTPYGYSELLSHVCTEQHDLKRYDVAAAVARVHVDYCRQGGSEFELSLAVALEELGFDLRRLGEPALDVAEEAVEILERYPSDQSTRRAYSSALSLLARELSRVGRHDEAIEAARRAADMERQRNGVNVLYALGSLHDVLAAAGHADEASRVDDELTRRTAAKPTDR
jgi:tetratricopeptide (TPR) repeat protein